MNTTRNRWLELVDEIGPGFDRDAARRDADDEFVASHYRVLQEAGSSRRLCLKSSGAAGPATGRWPPSSSASPIGSFDGAGAIHAVVRGRDGVSSLNLAKSAHRAAVSLNCEFNFTPSIELTNRVFMLKTAAVENAQRTVERAM